MEWFKVEAGEASAAAGGRKMCVKVKTEMQGAIQYRSIKMIITTYHGHKDDKIAGFTCVSNVGHIFK